MMVISGLFVLFLAVDPDVVPVRIPALELFPFGDFSPSLVHVLSRIPVLSRCSKA